MGYYAPFVYKMSFFVYGPIFMKLTFLESVRSADAKNGNFFPNWTKKIFTIFFKNSFTLLGHLSRFGAEIIFLNFCTPSENQFRGKMIQKILLYQGDILTRTKITF